MFKIFNSSVKKERVSVDRLVNGAQFFDIRIDSDSTTRVYSFDPSGLMALKESGFDRNGVHYEYKREEKFYTHDSGAKRLALSVIDKAMKSIEEDMRSDVTDAQIHLGLAQLRSHIKKQNTLINACRVLLKPKTA